MQQLQLSSSSFTIIIIMLHNIEWLVNHISHEKCQNNKNLKMSFMQTKQTKDTNETKERKILKNKNENA